MKIKSIISRRYYTKWRSWQLVYEWEDVLKEEMGIHFVPSPPESLSKLIPFYFKVPINKLWRYSPSFIFEMFPNKRHSNHNNSKYVLPCIIDWYLREGEELDRFYKYYSNHKIVFVTSRQVYCYLSEINAPIRFEHLPLSLSDKWMITPNTIFEKDIDVVLMGRQNPILLKWLYVYEQTHKNIIIVSSKKDSYDYFDQHGQYVANAKSRQDCMNLLKRSRVALYSTKGMDDDYAFCNTNGFNQVTPRLFESLATGNHVIARYVDNEDTEYFELKKICPHTNDYNSFEVQMNYALHNDVDMKKYSEYLSKHYTSIRVKMLENLIKEL